MKEIREADKQPRGKKENIYNILLILVVSGVIGVLMNLFIFQMASVSGTSMEGTLHDGDVLYTSKLTAKIFGVNRGDVVTTKKMEGISEEFLIKRVVGMPGDSIKVQGQEVYINGKRIDEKYASNIDDISNYEIEYKLEADEYFIMGDNRGLGMSYDSREFGPISGKDIMSIVRFKLRFFN